MDQNKQFPLETSKLLYMVKIKRQNIM